MTWVVPVRAEGHHGLLPGEKQQLSEAEDVKVVRGRR